MSIDLENEVLLLAVVVFFMVTTLGLLIMVMKQNQEIEDLQQESNKPATGFLGKPLASVGIMVLMLGGFGAMYFVSQTDREVVDVSASQDINATIETDATVLSARETEVTFQLIPAIGQQTWENGSLQDEFDIFWTVRGPTTFSQIELGVNSQNRSGFTRVIDRGNYEVTVEIVTEESFFTVSADRVF